MSLIIPTFRFSSSKLLFLEPPILKSALYDFILFVLFLFGFVGHYCVCALGTGFAVLLLAQY